MPTNAFRISATALLALLLFGCAPSSSGPNGITSGFQDALAPLNPQAYQTVKETEARKRYEQSSADYRAMAVRWGPDFGASNSACRGGRGDRIN
jgi:hypothetical protein